MFTASTNLFVSFMVCLVSNMPSDIGFLCFMFLKFGDYIASNNK
jgi:hypothetical protein